MRDNSSFGIAQPIIVSSEPDFVEIEAGIGSVQTQKSSANIYISLRLCGSNSASIRLSQNFALQY